MKIMTLHTGNFGFDPNPLLCGSITLKINPYHIVEFATNGIDTKKQIGTEHHLDTIKKVLSSMNLTLDDVGEKCTRITLSTGKQIDVFENVDFVE